jgi:tetratricopeptide (TPR) repeat protein
MLVNRRQRRTAARFKQKSKNAAAEDKARATTTSIADVLATGRRLHQIGRLADAEACYRQVLAVRPNHADALNLLGLAAHQMGRAETAVDAISRAIASDGQNPGYFSNLGNVLYSVGKFDDAVAAYRQAISINPNFADAFSNLGAALERQGKLVEAEAAYRQAIQIKPCFAEAYGNLGIVLKEQGKLGEAVAAFRRAISIQPNDAKACYNLGVALKECGSLDEVIAANRQAISIKPDFAEAFFNLGLALKELGKLDESRRMLEKAAELSPARAGNYRVLADARQFRSGDPYLTAMEKLAREMTSISPEEQIDLHFALAKAYDDLKEHERCFEHLLEGNALKRRCISYDEAATLDRFRRTKEVFTLELMRAKQDFGYPSPVPVFIVGMPRSGTTLIEQILASHPKVFGGGELNHIAIALSRLSQRDDPSRRFPAVISSMTAEQLGQFGANYVGAISTLAPGATRITDKMPLNFAYVGLIHLALPNARIIHARRHPLDTCFSCFSTLFAEDQPYSYDLAELGRFYHSYEALMDHWRSVLPQGVMLEVQYEDLIGNLEVEGRRMVAHCGLGWEDRCLFFHETERPVRTASAIQVRQPIYLSSIGRWRHYVRQLGPLIEALGFDLEDSPSTEEIEPRGAGPHCDPTNSLGGNSEETRVEYRPTPPRE